MKENKSDPALRPVTNSVTIIFIKKQCFNQTKLLFMTLKMRLNS